jgi:hypothetical protein
MDELIETIYVFEDKLLHAIPKVSWTTDMKMVIKCT